MTRARMIILLLAVFAFAMWASVRELDLRAVGPPAAPDGSSPTQDLSTGAGAISDFATPAKASTPGLPAESRTTYNLPWPWPATPSIEFGPKSGAVPSDQIDEFAEIDDPWVLDPAYAVDRLEEAELAIAGPALALSGINAVSTVNFGLNERTSRPVREVILTNVGDAPLKISRIYAGCGCVEARIDGSAINPAGWLDPKLTIAPGDSIPLRIAIRLDGGDFKAGEARAIYLQLYTNDPRSPQFDLQDDASFERRIRLVVGID